MTSSSEDLVAALSSESPSQRAGAAMWLISHPEQISTRDLMRAMQAETVPQVRLALVEVLERRQKSSLNQSEGSTSAAQGEQSILSASSEGTGDIAALIRHELAPAVGWIRLAADAEIEDFASSRTNDSIRRLQLRIDGLVTLIKSRTELDLRLVDLPRALLDNWPDPNSRPRITPDPRDSSVEINTDESLFSLMIANIFQNAIDASIDATGQAEVDVAWGATDQNYWVRVSNPFRGDRLSLDQVAHDGLSSKAGHLGKGLALIRTVSARLGIGVALDGASGTAAFTLRGEQGGG